ncbi:MAG: DUF4169 family protein [Hyphomicrobium sp.]|jgi:hypothetical protein|nr:DUF4169 family protein [Hyphomicrobium sp.]
MSTEIINLRRARKTKQRQQAETKAAENRAKFGQSKAARAAKDAEQDLEARRLDALRRERGDGGAAE